VFTEKTLKKRDGICGRCFNAKGITKANIPRIIKDKVWITYVGDKANGQCYVCEKKITMSNFQAGHIKSEYDGGKISVPNLRPVCKSCNVKTGVFNMDDIKNALSTEQIVAAFDMDKVKADVSNNPCRNCGVKSLYRAKCCTMIGCTTCHYEHENSDPWLGGCPGCHTPTDYSKYILVNADS
jgi:hypothetical protein